MQKDVNDTLERHASINGYSKKEEHILLYEGVKSVIEGYVFTNNAPDKSRNSIRLYFYCKICTIEVLNCSKLQYNVT